MSVNKTKGLGRGIGSLLPPAPAMAKNEAKVEVAANQLRANPYQPRRDFDEAKLGELADSIRQHGIIQPLIVRPADPGYEIVAGERRWRAAQRVALEKVPVVVRDYSNEQMMQIALIENLQRQDLNPIEEALAFKRLMAELDLTQEEAAQKIGRSRSAVANALRLLNLPEKVQALLAEGSLTTGQARPLLALAGEEEQALAAGQIVGQGMSARAVEEYVKGLGGQGVPADSPGKKTKPPKQEKEPTPDVHLAAVQDDLALFLSAKVQIKRTGGGEGKIVIDFHSDDDLERLLDILDWARAGSRPKHKTWVD